MKSGCVEIALLFFTSVTIGYHSYGGGIVNTDRGPSWMTQRARTTYIT
jgi:hypothetical protein